MESSEDRLKFRMAWGRGCSVAELEETTSYHEWVYWVVFHSLYDLPDGFLVAAQLGALVSRVAGGKGKASDFAPYFTPPPDKAANPDLKSAFAFLRANVPHKRRKPQ